MDKLNVMIVSFVAVVLSKAVHSSANRKTELGKWWFWSFNRTIALCHKI